MLLSVDSHELIEIINSIDEIGILSNLSHSIKIAYKDILEHYDYVKMDRRLNEYDVLNSIDEVAIVGYIYLMDAVIERSRVLLNCY